MMVELTADTKVRVTAEDRDEPEVVTMEDLVAELYLCGTEELLDILGQLFQEGKAEGGGGAAATFQYEVISGD